MIYLFAVLTGLFALLLWRQWWLGRALKSLEAQIAALEAVPRPDPLLLDQALAGSGRTLITLEILNPMELALKESVLAQVFGGVTPEIVRQQVYKQVAERMQKQLQDQGVSAELRVIRGT